MMEKNVTTMVETALVPKRFAEMVQNNEAEKRRQAHEKEIEDAVESLVQDVAAEVDAANETILPLVERLRKDRFFRLDSAIFLDLEQGVLFPNPVHHKCHFLTTEFLVTLGAMLYSGSKHEKFLRHCQEEERERKESRIADWLEFGANQGRLPNRKEATSILQDFPLLQKCMQDCKSVWKQCPLEHIMSQETFFDVDRHWTERDSLVSPRSAYLVLPVCDVPTQVQTFRTSEFSVSVLKECLYALKVSGYHFIYSLDEEWELDIDAICSLLDQVRKKCLEEYTSFKEDKIVFFTESFRRDTLKEYHVAHPLEPVEEMPLDVAHLLLDCDKVRADMASYPPSVLTDTNQGHWELAESLGAAKELPKNSPFERVTLPRPLVARPPQMDVHASGTCAIDFGTKSTVVACRDKGERLLRIGKGNFDAAPQASDYENPTVMEFRDLAGFRKSYAARDGRPFTEWEQMTVSHHAREQLLNAEHADGRASFFSELKQWANSDSAVRHVRDGKGVDLVLPAYTTLEDGAFDPIELYAYDLGLYINNMMNGIYLDYVLSYPVKYPKDVCERIRQSFERGLKKSLPPAILHDAALMQDFRVYLGASEPAAYASCALQALSETHPALEPSEDASVAYAVFDFGGGTTDFDYGIWRLPTDDDGGHWNYVLETFAAGSDPHLGGEKLLDQLAYRVYQDNLPALRSAHIPIVLPEDAQPFAGGERLINASDAAYMNLKQLAELLRPVWEAPDGEACKTLGKEPQSVTLFTDAAMAQTKTGDAKAEGNHVVVKLDIKVEPLQAYLRARIQRGIDNFFTGLWHAFQEDEVRQIHILLAGNSCRSQLVQELFRAAIEKAEAGIEATGRKMQQPGSAKGMLVLYPPLHSGTDAAKGTKITKAAKGAKTAEAPALAFDRMPTGKTGVAFGLLDCRRGGHDVKIIDWNRTKDREAAFPYYLGANGRKDKFFVRIGKKVGYGEWKPFLALDAEDDAFELYYTTEAKALENNMPTADLPAPARCRVHYNGGTRGGWVWLRKVAPHAIEYTVTPAKDVAPEEGKTLAKIERCALEGEQHG